MYCQNAMMHNMQINMQGYAGNSLLINSYR